MPAPKAVAELVDDVDRRMLRRVHELALQAERSGNLPIACVIAEAGEVVAEGENRTLAPVYHPGLHAEVEALRRVPCELWETASELTLYTSLEPCLMCFGAIILHGVGRVVFGAPDPLGGATAIAPHLPAYVLAKAQAIEWIGPVLPDLFVPLCDRALRLGRGGRRPVQL